MQADISPDFPSSAQEFWAGKPDDVTPWGWLFHPLNPYRFALWVAKFLNKVRYYSRLKKFTCFFQRNIARWLDVSEQWLREIIHRLKLIGVIDDRKIWRSRQYRVVEGILAAPAETSTCGESFGEKSPPSPSTAAESVACGGASQSYKKHHDQECRSRVPIIKADDRPADPIAQIFEETTGTRYNELRDGRALAQLREFPQIAVVAGVLMSRLRAPGTRINSLAYCIAAVKEVMAALNTPVQNEISRKTTAHTLTLTGLSEYVRYLKKKFSRLKQGVSVNGDTLL